MAGEIRLPPGMESDASVERGFLFWMDDSVSGWDAVSAELEAAFVGSRNAASNEEPIVYVVSNDALLGRAGPEAAMVASGLLSGARTAAIEGSRKGWTVNTIAYDPDHADTAAIIEKAVWLMGDGSITGELIHVGPGHIGKALA